MQSLSRLSDPGRFPVTGRGLLVLDDPARFLTVDHGRADIFVTRLNPDGEPGTRHHLLTVVPGERVFGMQPGPDRLALVAAGVGECVFQSESVEKAETGETFVQAFSGWADQCCDTILAGERPQQQAVLAGGPGEVALEADSCLRVTRPGLWVVSCDSELEFMTLPLTSADLPVLLPEKAWLCTRTACQVVLADLDGLPREKGRANAVQPFQKLVVQGMESRAVRERDDERVRYRKQRAVDRFHLAKTLREMAGILRPAGPDPGIQGASPLLSAVIAVAAAAGIRVAGDSAAIDLGGAADLLDIARHNRFRTREIIIAGEWWWTDHGPLLGFLDEGNRPVALIPRRSGYVCLDPTTGTTRPVTPGVAEGIAARAHMFYRPFPDRKLDWQDLLAFGSFRSGADLVWLIAMGLLAGVLGLLSPLATGLIIGTFIPDASVKGIVQITLVLGATACAIALFSLVKGLAAIRIEGRMDLALQAAVWDRLLALPVPFFKQFTAGDLAVRSMGINAIREILSGVTLNAVLTLIFTSVNLAFLFYYDWQMALVAILLTGIGATVTFGAGLMVIVYQKALFDIKGRLSGTMLQFITGINKLRSTGTENRAFAVFAREYLKQKQLNFRSGKVDAVLSAFNAIFPVLVSMILFSWYYWFRQEHMAVAGFVAFTSAYVTFQTALMQLSMIMPNTAAVIPLYQRALPILQALPETAEADRKPGRLTGSIEVSHLDFRYASDAPLILQDVSLTVGKGELVALVGGSGAGKSTLVRLLLGFETPESGGVFFDGKELKNLDVREVRRQIGVVLQQGKLMSGDIFRNIVGTGNLTLDDAWEAARMVGLDEDIKAMPMNMHTIIPAGGGSLSGGQRQRLLIARAIATRPNMLFFDEATSALDNQTQAIVSRSLESLKVTRVVIAHRLSTIINADRIYVMHQGRIAETGTYDELMALKGHFHDLAKRQIA